MGDKIGIMGAGALGSYVGAFLNRIGEDVTFIDMWPAHESKMNKTGLDVTGSQGPFNVPVKAMGLTDAQNIAVPFDWVFIAVKSYDTEWATHFIKRYVRDDGFFVSLQNCWNDVPIGEIVGPQRQLGCIASHIEVALWERALVTRGGAVGRDSGHTVFRVGEQDGRITPRAEMVAGLLDNIDAAYASDNLWGERWAKLSQNSMGNGISASTGMGSQQMAEDPRLRKIRIHLAKEAASVGLAMGLKVVPIQGMPAETWADADKGDVFEELDGFMSAHGGRVNWLASMAQDVYKGRRSEINMMNGLVAAKGREVAIPTPYNDAVIEVMNGIDDKTLEQSEDHVERVLNAVAR